jgi:hypothetical protein
MHGNSSRETKSAYRLMIDTARANGLMAEMIRRYAVLGFECSLVEARKLAWFLMVATERFGLGTPIADDFTPTIQEAITSWPGPAGSAERKARIFGPREIGIAIDHLRRVDGARLSLKAALDCRAAKRRRATTTRTLPTHEWAKISRAKKVRNRLKPFWFRMTVSLGNGWSNDVRP